MQVVIAVRSGETRGGDALVDDFYALRARVFGEQLKWQVSVRAGRERDEYDALSPTYIVALDHPAGRVIGGARLLPLSGPTMLNGPFSFLLENGPFRHPQGLESSRFCIDRVAGQPVSRQGGTNPATLALLSAILGFAENSNAPVIATVTEVRLERLLRAQGLGFTRLGPPKPIGGTRAVAGVIAVAKGDAIRLLPKGWILDLPGSGQVSP